MSYTGLGQYQDLAQSHISLYVEEELLKYLPRLIGFVKDCEDSRGGGCGGGGGSSGTGGGGGGGGGAAAAAAAAAAASRSSASASSSVADAETAGTLLLQFEREWKEIVKRVDSDIIVGFSNFRTGSDILKKVCCGLLSLCVLFFLLFAVFVLF